MRNSLLLPTIFAAVFVLALSFTAVVFGGVRFRDLSWQSSDAQPVQYATGSWLLRAASIDGENIEPVTESHDVSLTFDAGRILGMGECGSYQAFYGLERDDLQLSSLTISPEPCEDQDKEQIEAAFFAALDRVDKIGRANDVLSLFGDRVVLTFDEDE